MSVCHICVWYMHASLQICTPMHVYVEARGGHLVTLSMALHLIVLRQDGSLNWNLTIWAGWLVRVLHLHTLSAALSAEVTGSTAKPILSRGH